MAATPACRAHIDVAHVTHTLLRLLLLCSVGLLGHAILAEPVALRFRLEADTLIVSDLVTAIAAHDISTILAFVAVLIPRPFFLLLLLLIFFLFVVIGVLLLLLLRCLLRTALFFLVRVVIGLVRFRVLFLADHLAVFLNDNLSGSAPSSPWLNTASLDYLSLLLLAGCDGFLGATS